MMSFPKKSLIKENIGNVVQIKTTFEWSIKNFSDFCKNAGDTVYSPVFTHGSHLEFSWQFEFNSNRTNEKGINFLSLYLRNVNGHDVKTTFILSIMDYKIRKGFDITFNFNKPSWGWKYFVDIKDVIESIKSSDDIITIKCEICNACILNESNNSQIFNTKLKALGDIGQLYNDKNSSDVIVRVDSKEFHVHRIILSARSEEFAAMFEDDMIGNRKNVIVIEGVRSEIMDAMLKFLYTGKVENTKEIAKELFVAADRYAIEDLKGICLFELGKINSNTVIDLLLFAEQYNLNELKTKTMDFIAKNFKKVEGKPKFELVKNSPNVIKDLLSKLAVNFET